MPQSEAEKAKQPDRLTPGAIKQALDLFHKLDEANCPAFQDGSEQFDHKTAVVGLLQTLDNRQYKIAAEIEEHKRALRLVGKTEEPLRVAGISVEEVDQTIQTLDLIRKIKPANTTMKDYEAGIKPIIAELQIVRADVEEGVKFQKQRQEATQRQLEHRQRAKQLSRREALQGLGALAVLAPVVIAGGWVGFDILQTIWGVTGGHLDWERQNQLPSAESSVISESGWTVRYVPPSKNYTFKPTSYKTKSMDTYMSAFITFPKSFMGLSDDYLGTSIDADLDDTFNNNKTIKFSIRESPDELAPHSYSMPLTSSGHLEDSVVMFENKVAAKQIYARFVQEDYHTFKMEFLDRVPTNS